MHLLRRTHSICPHCFQRIPAQLVQRGGVVFLEKHCPEHGFYSIVTWRGAPELPEWAGPLLQLPEVEEAALGNCPHACGLCSHHTQTTCCLLLEITRRCNLACPHCFAAANQHAGADDPPLEQVLAWVDAIAATGQAFLQLSGGEPTLRPDLPEIVRHAREKGCAYVQLNSNGLRLAQDETLVKHLAEAGLSFVFLQFDGTTDAIFRTMRGAPLLAQKMRAIELCGKYNIGVTLVPTLVPGVNMDNVGEIIRLAVAHSPVVRGVHFQPVSHFGRCPHTPKNTGSDKSVPDNTGPEDATRVTLPEVYSAIFAQAGDIVPHGSIAPSRCDHPRCGFHGAYIAMPEGLVPIKQKNTSCCPGPSHENKTHFPMQSALPQTPQCCSPAPQQPAVPIATGEANRHFVGLRWQRKEGCCDAKGEPSLNTLEGFLQRAKSHSFTLSAMAFQDAYTLDLERLRQCSLHVFDNGKITPFCAYYIMQQTPSWLPHHDDVQ